MTRIAIDLGQMVTAETKALRLQAEARARIRNRRDQAIAAGITLNGWVISTDDLSQSRIMGAAISAMLDPSYSVQWKTADGFVPLDAPTVLALAQAIRAHVQACFDREAALLAAQTAGLPDDIDAGWP